MTNHTPVEDLNLSVRSYNTLKNNGVDSVEDLLTKTTDDFMRMRNMGRKSLHEIETKMEEVRGDYK